MAQLAATTPEDVQKREKLNNLMIKIKESMTVLSEVRSKQDDDAKGGGGWWPSGKGWGESVEGGGFFSQRR